MDLPQIGAHCALSSCSVLDFLPITCKCDKQFCSEHINPDYHDCSACLRATLSTSAEPIQRCTIDGCNKASLQMGNGDLNETCSSCHKSFCADHRFPDLHRCPPILKGESDNKIVNTVSVWQSGHTIVRNCKPPRDPAKLVQWQKVELMKMRHRAVPGDPKNRNASVPPDQRHHIRIVAENNEKVFWFKKTIITGKALDLLAGQLAFHSSTPLQLGRVGPIGSETLTLRCDKLLSEQVEDGCELAIQVRGKQ